VRMTRNVYSIGTLVDVHNAFKLRLGLDPGGDVMQLQASWYGGDTGIVTVPNRADLTLFAIDVFCGRHDDRCFLYINLNGTRTKVAAPAGLDTESTRVELCDIVLGSSAPNDYFIGALRAFNIYSSNTLNNWNTVSSSLYARGVGAPDALVSRPSMRLPQFSKPIARLVAKRLRSTGLFNADAISSFTGSHRVHLVTGATPERGTLVKCIGQATLRPKVSQSSPIVVPCGAGEVAFGVYDQFNRASNMHMVISVGEGALRVPKNQSIAAGQLLVCGADGLAVPQADDVVRANTVAKSTHTIEGMVGAVGSRLLAVTFMM